MKHWKLVGLLAVCAMILVPFGAMADSISPSTVTIDASTTSVTSVVIHKTVTVSALGATQADIFFLSDTTGSMGGTIDTVRTNAAAIMTQTAAIIGPSTAWGVGEYKDGNPAFSSDPFGYRLNQAITTNQAAVQAGINLWSASGGGDLPEDNLYGVRAAATNTPTGTDPFSGWRAGSTRILVQFGDAPGHDPASDGTTLATATTALTSTGTKLIAVDVGAKNSTGQETAMTAASGGTYLPPGTSGTDLVNAVIAAITSSVSTYHTVALAVVPLVDDLAPVMVSFPSSYTGDFTRDIDRNFDFDIVLSGCCRAFDERSFDFDIAALVDGAVVAVEHDHWNCVVPVPPTVFLLASGLLGLIPLRKKIKLT